MQAEAPAEIGLLLYPGAQAAAVHGLTDLLAVAGRLNHAADGPALRVSHWQPGADGVPACVFDSDPALPHALAAVVAPPALGEPPAASPAVADFLRRAHGAGALLGSVCAGAFVLAGAGLLDGRRATTHWTYGDELAARHPALTVDCDRLLIDEGDVVTAGGVMAWTDLGLLLVARFLGPAAMMATARFLLIDPPGREQRYYAPFEPRLRHGDGAVLKVQHWLAGGAALGPVAVPEMAARAGLEERTFLRRFSRATGFRPIEYCQHLRVAEARRRLEATRDAVDRIAFAVGYQDPAAFRKLFQKLVGLTPGDYRRRFGA
ncbi:GlxA family transcriptional regulator [Zavarzinia sp.]|uniref:GlxA family transcriptional regulator n=1 Tax=Zavarzinia sp. TaxID=2027920 RepID=UPI003563F2F0